MRTRVTYINSDSTNYAVGPDNGSVNIEVNNFRALDNKFTIYVVEHDSATETKASGIQVLHPNNPAVELRLDENQKLTNFIIKFHHASEYSVYSDEETRFVSILISSGVKEFMSVEAPEFQDKNLNANDVEREILKSRLGALYLQDQRDLFGLLATEDHKRITYDNMFPIDIVTHPIDQSNWVEESTGVFKHTTMIIPKTTIDLELKKDNYLIDHVAAFLQLQWFGGTQSGGGRLENLHITLFRKTIFETSDGEKVCLDDGLVEDAQTQPNFNSLIVPLDHEPVLIPEDKQIVAFWVDLVICVEHTDPAQTIITHPDFSASDFSGVGELTLTQEVDSLPVLYDRSVETVVESRIDTAPVLVTDSLPENPEQGALISLNTSVRLGGVTNFLWDSSGKDYIDAGFTTLQQEGGINHFRTALAGDALNMLHAVGVLPPYVGERTYITPEFIYDAWGPSVQRGLVSEILYFAFYWCDLGLGSIYSTEPTDTVSGTLADFPTTDDPLYVKYTRRLATNEQDGGVTIPEISLCGYTIPQTRVPGESSVWHQFLGSVIESYVYSIKEIIYRSPIDNMPRHYKLDLSAFDGVNYRSAFVPVDGVINTGGRTLTPGVYRFEGGEWVRKYLDVRDVTPGSGSQDDQTQQEVASLTGRVTENELDIATIQTKRLITDTPLSLTHPETEPHDIGVSRRQVAKELNSVEGSGTDLTVSDVYSKTAAVLLRGNVNNTGISFQTNIFLQSGTTASKSIGWGLTPFQDIKMNSFYGVSETDLHDVEAKFSVYVADLAGVDNALGNLVTSQTGTLSKINDVAGSEHDTLYSHGKTFGVYNFQVGDPIILQKDVSYRIIVERVDGGDIETIQNGTSANVKDGFVLETMSEFNKYDVQDFGMDPKVYKYATVATGATSALGSLGNQTKDLDLIPCLFTYDLLLQVAPTTTVLPTGIAGPAADANLTIDMVNNSSPTWAATTDFDMKFLSEAPTTLSLLDPTWVATKTFGDGATDGNVIIRTNKDIDLTLLRVQNVGSGGTSLIHGNQFTPLEAGDPTSAEFQTAMQAVGGPGLTWQTETWNPATDSGVIQGRAQKHTANSFHTRAIGALLAEVGECGSPGQRKFGFVLQTFAGSDSYESVPTCSVVVTSTYGSYPTSRAVTYLRIYKSVDSDEIVKVYGIPNFDPTGPTQSYTLLAHVDRNKDYYTASTTPITGNVVTPQKNTTPEERSTFYGNVANLPAPSSGGGGGGATRISKITFTDATNPVTFILPGTNYIGTTAGTYDGHDIIWFNEHDLKQVHAFDVNTGARLAQYDIPGTGNHGLSNPTGVAFVTNSSGSFMYHSNWGGASGAKIFVTNMNDRNSFVTDLIIPYPSTGCLDIEYYKGFLYLTLDRYITVMNATSKNIIDTQWFSQGVFSEHRGVVKFRDLLFLSGSNNVKIRILDARTLSQVFTIVPEVDILPGTSTLSIFNNRLFILQTNGTVTEKLITATEERSTFHGNVANLPTPDPTPSSGGSGVGRKNLIFTRDVSQDIQLPSADYRDLHAQEWDGNPVMWVVNNTIDVVQAFNYTNAARFSQYDVPPTGDVAVTSPTGVTILERDENSYMYINDWSGSSMVVYDMADRTTRPPNTDISGLPSNSLGVDNHDGLLYVASPGYIQVVKPDLRKPVGAINYKSPDVSNILSVAVVYPFVLSVIANSNFLYVYDLVNGVHRFDLAFDIGADINSIVGLDYHNSTLRVINRSGAVKVYTVTITEE